MSLWTLLELFTVFLKIGALMIGGGYAMIPLAKHEIVVKRAWLSEKEFLDVIAIAESTPGPISLNLATYVGYKKAGLPGALISTVGVSLPAFLIIIAIASALTKYYENPVVQSALKGVRGAVVGLIAAALISVAHAAVRELNHSQVAVVVLIAICCFLAYQFLKVDPAVLIVTAAILGLILGLLGYW